MSTLRKLRRKDPSPGHAIEPLGMPSLLLERKISEALLEFAEPLLQNIDDDRLFDEAIAFAALCWNLALAPSQEQRAHLRNTVNAMAGSDLFRRHGIQQTIQMLLDRKKALFADDSRLIVDYTIIQEKAGPRLLVMSTPVGDGYEGHEANP